MKNLLNKFGYLQTFAAIDNSTPARIVGGSDAGKLKGDQVIVRVLDILQNEKIGSMRNMFATYIKNGKVFTFKTPERLIPAHYVATGGNKTQFGTVKEVDILADKGHMMKHPIEEMDFATQVLAQEEEARLAAELVKGIDAHLDAEILDTLVKAIPGTGVTYTDIGIIDPTTDATKVEKLWNTIAYKADLLKMKVTKTSRGVDGKELMVLTSLPVLTKLSSYLKTYTDKNTEILIKGSDVVGLRVNNITILAHPYLGNTFPAGSLHEKQAYDFAGHECIIVHKDALGVVFNVPTGSTKTTIDPDTFNQVIGTKYQYGLGVLRPNYIEEVSLLLNAGAAKTAYGTATVISADIPTTNPSTKA